MKNTTNYGLKKPEGTDVVNVEDFNANADIIDNKLKELETSEIFYAVATGSANTYAVSISALNTLTAYYDGLAVCVKINVASTGASTLNINNWGIKNIIDSLGNPINAGGLKAGIPYTLRYNGVNFILQGKGGGGNLTADKLLIGSTATGDTGEVIGTMPNYAGSTIATVGETTIITAIDTFVGNGNATYGTLSHKLKASGYVNTETIVKHNIMGLNPASIKAGHPIGSSTLGITGTFTADGTAVASDMLSGKTAYVNGAKVTGTIPSKGSATITPGTTNQTISANQYLSGIQTIAGDSNLVTGNIRAGATVFGIAGKSSVVETADGTATAGQVLATKTAYVNGVKVTGTMPNYSGGTHVTGTNKTAGVYSTSYGDNGVNAYIQPPSGYYDGQSWVKTAEPGLIPSNITNNANIMGVQGTAKALPSRVNFGDGTFIFKKFNNGAGSIGHPTFTTIHNGKVYAMYGNKLLEYDLANYTFMYRYPTGAGQQLAFAGANHTTYADNGDGTFIGYGGAYGSTDLSLHIYDINTLTATKVITSWNLTECTTINWGVGVSYHFGGIVRSSSTTYTIQKTAYRFDKVTNTFTTLASMPTARNGANAVRFGDNIYIVGGVIVSPDTTTGYIYNTLTNTYSTMTVLGAGGSIGTASAVADSRYIHLMYGDYDDTQQYWYRYDTTTNTWTFHQGRLPHRFMAYNNFSLIDGVYYSASYDIDCLAIYMQ